MIALQYGAYIGFINAYSLHFRYVLVVIAWIFFIWAVYRVAQIKTDHVEYDPYEVLGVDRVSIVNDSILRYFFATTAEQFAMVLAPLTQPDC